MAAPSIRVPGSGKPDRDLRVGRSSVARRRMAVCRRQEALRQRATTCVADVGSQNLPRDFTTGALADVCWPPMSIAAGSAIGRRPRRADLRNLPANVIAVYPAIARRGRSPDLRNLPANIHRDRPGIGRRPRRADLRKSIRCQWGWSPDLRNLPANVHRGRAAIGRRPRRADLR